MKRKILLLMIAGLLLNVSTVWASWDGQAPLYFVNKATRFFDVGLAELGSRGAFVSNGETAYADKYHEDYIGDWGKLLGVPLHPANCDCKGSYEVHWRRSQLVDIITGWSPEQLEKLSQSLDSGVWDESLGYNSAAKMIKDQDALEYLILSRELENMRCFLPDNWAYLREGYVGPTCDFVGFMERALTGYESADTPDLKLRYAFQYSRLLFYSGRHEALIAFYEDEIADLTDGSVKEWCRSFYGGSLFNVGRYEDAFTAFVLVFHRSERYERSAINSLKITNEYYNDSDIIAQRGMYKAITANPQWAFMSDYWFDMRTLKSEDPKKLATLQGLYIIAFYDVKQKARALNPVSPAEAVLVLSAKSYLNKDLNGMLQSALAIHANGDELRYGLEKIVSEGIYKADRETEVLLLEMAEVREPAAFWCLAAAYVAIKHKDGEAALNHLEQAIANDAEKLFPAQLLVLQLYHEAALGSLDAGGEARLAEMFTRMDAMYQFWTVPSDAVGDDHKGKELTWQPEMFFARTAASDPAEAYATGLALLQSRRGLLESVLAKRYMEQGRYERAFFCLVMVDEVFGDYFMGPDPDQYSKEFFSAYRSYGLYESRKDITAILSRPGG